MQGLILESYRILGWTNVHPSIPLSIWYISVSKQFDKPEFLPRVVHIMKRRVLNILTLTIFHNSKSVAKMSVARISVAKMSVDKMSVAKM